MKRLADSLPLALLLLVVGLPLVSGCTSEWVRADASARSPQSVAVLPFLAAGDLSEEPQAQHYAELMGTILTGRLASGPYLLLPPAEAWRRLQGAGLTAASARSTTPARLREVLGVDLAIRGDLIEDLHVQAGLVYWRSVGCRIEATDLRDGARFALVESLEVDFGGLLMEMGQPVEGIEDSIDSHTELAFVRLAEFLADSLLRCLPAPEQAPKPAPPQIQEVEAEVFRGRVASRARVGPQSTIRVSLRGDPGQRASLRLSGGRAIPLLEEPAGFYRGLYRVARGDHCERPWVVLSDSFGASSVHSLDLAFDLRPPLPPRELQAALRGEEIGLGWSAPRSADVPRGRYVVYALTREGAVKELTRVSGQAAQVKADSEVTHYLVAALSEAGVLGATVSVSAPGSELERTGS